MIILYIVTCCFVPISTARYPTLVTSLFIFNIILFPSIYTQHVFLSFLSDYCRASPLFHPKKYVEQGDKVTPSRCGFLCVQKRIPFNFQITLYGYYVRHPI